MSELDEKRQRLIDTLEATRRQITKERDQAVQALVHLYERLGEDDEDVQVLDVVITAWRRYLLALADVSTRQHLLPPPEKPS